MQDVERLESTIREYTGFIAEQYEGCMLGIIAKTSSPCPCTGKRLAALSG